MSISRCLILMGFLFFSPGASADNLKPLNPEADHVERWNWFAERVYTLHKQEIRKFDIKTITRVGGYYREPRFYKEVKYIDKKSGRLISTIQWERKNPDRIHWIEVNIYDAKGRVARDYSAAYLTFSRNAPQGTTINFHAYHKALHAFRQFDATDDLAYEFCNGTYKGKPVDIRLDYVEILEAEDQPDGPFSKPEYKVCFAGLPKKSAGKYLTPQ